MNLIKYRNDIRGIAFRAILLSKNKKIVVVEGDLDQEIYQNKFKIKTSEIIVEKSNFSNKNSGSNKNKVLKLKNIIDKIEPKNKNISYLVDKDYENTQENPPLFVTDYYSIENYALVWDKDNKIFNKISDLKDENTKQYLRKILVCPNPIQINTKNMLGKVYKKEYGIIENDDLVLKKVRGKTLVKHLLKNGVRIKKAFIKMDFEDFPVLDRIVKYFRL